MGSVAAITLALALNGAGVASADPSASISGTVTDAAIGTPVSGATVNLDLPGGTYVQSVETDAAGHYSFGSLDAAGYVVEFQGDETHAGEWWRRANTSSAAATIRVADGAAVTNIDAALAAPSSVSGTATFQGSPAAYEGITILRPDGSYAGYAQADTSGNYSVTGLPTGRYTAQFSSNQFGSGPHWIPQWWNGSDTAAGASYFDVGVGSAVTGIDAALRAGSSISGKVTFPAGVTLGQFAAVNAETRDHGEAGSGNIAADGSYTIDGLPAGEYTLRFGPGFGGNASPVYLGGTRTAAHATYVSVGSNDALAGYNLAVQQAGSISGRITSSGGTAPQGAGVEAFADDDLVLSVGGGFVGFDGSYRITGLTPGSYLIRFDEGQPDTDTGQWWKSAPSAAAATPVTVTAGGEVTGIDAALTPGGSASGTVRGRTSAGGLVVPPNVQLDVRDASGTIAQVGGEAVQPDGSWQISNLATGTYTLRFQPEPDTTDFAAKTVTVKITAGQTRAGVDVVLPSTDLRTGQTLVAGTAKVGRTLTARTPGWGPAPVSFAYRWLRAGVPIDGATQSTYLVTNADAASPLAVQVTAARDGFTTETTLSADTALVSGGRLSTATPTISGTGRVGSTLTAVAGDWGPGSVTLAYQWRRNGSAISGATGAEYVPTTADAGARISVAVTGSKAGFDSATKVSTGVRIASG